MASFARSWRRLVETETGEVTDDTQMSLCIARSLVAVGWSPPDIAERFAAWFKGWPVDVGNTCRRGIARYINHGTLAAHSTKATPATAPPCAWPLWPWPPGRWPPA